MSLGTKPLYLERHFQVSLAHPRDSVVRHELVLRPLLTNNDLVVPPANSTVEACVAAGRCPIW